MNERAYTPQVPARRPGGKPDEKPPFRVLVHRRQLERWEQLPDRVGMESAQQFYDHVSTTPGGAPAVNSSTVLKGKAGKPRREGFSRMIHYEISGAGRIDYQWNAEYRTSPDADAHGVVFIWSIDLSSH